MTNDTNRLVQTDNIATSFTEIWACFNHVIRFKYARGNQHGRTEHGSCGICGKRFKRVIHWGNRRSAEWWKAT